LLLLENELVQLRALEYEDVDLLYRWENNPEIWQVSNTLVPYSKYVLNKYIESSHHDLFESRQLRLIIEAKYTGKAVGAIDLFDFEPYHTRAGIGILIAEKEERKKGYAGAALDVLIDYCFKHLKMHQLYCNIAIDNKNSLKLFKDKGFDVIGVKKDWIRGVKGWIDEYMLQKINPMNF
jgi:diamine N-acetyltransferase